jgi:hypothetical protein
MGRRWRRRRRRKKSRRRFLIVTGSPGGGHPRNPGLGGLANCKTAKQLPLNKIRMLLNLRPDNLIRRER